MKEMTHKKVASRSTVLLVLLMCASLVQASVLYRYRGANDEVVIDDRIPPEFVEKGYEVLNSSGIVIERVAPALTEEQRARLTEAQRLEEARKKQAEEDAKLLERFSDASDAVRARDRQLGALDTLIVVAEGNIKKLKQDEERELAYAAADERAGREVRQDVLDSLERIREQIRAAEIQIEKQREEQKKIRAQYQVMIDRLNEIAQGRRGGTEKEDSNTW